MDLGVVYLNIALDGFKNMKKTAERAIAQLDFQQLHWTPDDESNSIARIVKHLSGNMVSRWTDFLTSDGEKPTRDRDAEFEGGYASQQEFTTAWNTGWERLFDALGSLNPDDLLKTVYIRAEPHSVIQAIERQVTHVSYHVGQIVYLAKQIRSSKWQTLSIARGQSKEFLGEMVKRFNQDHTAKEN